MFRSYRGFPLVRETPGGRWREQASTNPAGGNHAIDRRRPTGPNEPTRPEMVSEARGAPANGDRGFYRPR